MEIEVGFAIEILIEMPMVIEAANGIGSTTEAEVEVEVEIATVIGLLGC